MGINELYRIQNIILEFTTPEIINEITLPSELLDPRADEEISERFAFIFHKVIGPIYITVSEVLKRHLSTTEIGFISERVQSCLKEKGL